MHTTEKAGVGHQFLNWLTGATLAQKYHLQQIHCPFFGEHIEKGVVYPVGVWENFLGFGKNLLTENDIPKETQVVKIPQFKYTTSSTSALFKKCIGDNCSQNVVFECPYNSFIDIDWTYYSNNDLREKYDLARQETPVSSHFDPNFINVAVHIRRGEINEKKYPQRWISTQEYYKIMKKLQEKSRNLFFHIYSLGEIGDFKELQDFENIKFHLNESDLISLDHMVRSDIFVNSKSAFAVLINYLHKGYKICFPWDGYCFPDLYHNIDDGKLNEFMASRRFV